MTVRKIPRKSRPLSLAAVKRELADVARIGQAFVDGDLCRKIYRPLGETFTNSDDIDLEPATCVPLKQTLMKLERLARIPCVCALWRRRPDMPEVGEPTLFGSFASPMHIYRPPMSGSTRKFEPPSMFEELQSAFQGRATWKITGSAAAVVAARRGLCVSVRGIGTPAFIEYFVPVRDSMGEIAAVLEVFIATSERRPHPGFAPAKPGRQRED
jgi:hypothetical protein